MTATTVLPAPVAVARPRAVSPPVLRAPRGVLRLLRRLVSWTVLAVFGVAWLLIGLQAAGQVKLATVLTGSMRPGYPPGSVLVDRPLPVAQLEVGDVITYTAPPPRSFVVTHRVTGIERTPDGVVLTTKGDANAADDPWKALIRDSHVWQVKAAVPGLGLALQELRSRDARVVWSMLVPLLAGAWAVTAIWRPSGPASRPRHARP